MITLNNINSPKTDTSSTTTINKKSKQKKSPPTKTTQQQPPPPPPPLLLASTSTSSSSSNSKTTTTTTSKSTKNDFRSFFDLFLQRFHRLDSNSNSNNYSSIKKDASTSKYNNRSVASKKPSKSSKELLIQNVDIQNLNEITSEDLNNTTRNNNNEINNNKTNGDECQLCYTIQIAPLESMYELSRSCMHTFCVDCLQSYLKLEIMESRIDIACPQCEQQMHPNDIYQLILSSKNSNKNNILNSTSPSK